MIGRPPFDGFSGPAGLIDRMIGEEYDVVKSVAEKINDLQTILVAIQQIQDFDALLALLTAARDAAGTSAQAAAASQATTLSLKNATDTLRGQAQDYSQAAASARADALQFKNDAAASANSASNSAVSAGTSAASAINSATVAQA